MNFKDDWLLNLLRPLVEVLAGNIDSPGANPSDLRAHSLVESYLANPESRTRIIEHLKAAHKRLKYPIPYFQIAATLRYESVIQGKSQPHFQAEFLENSRAITSADEIYPEPGTTSNLDIADCRMIQLGTVNIVGETITDRPKTHEIHVLAYSGDIKNPNGGLDLVMRGAQRISKWNLGTIQASPGSGKDPLEVEVKFLKPPRPRN